MSEPPGVLLVADFPHMNFTQMHERLRLELLRRIQRGTLSVSLLSRQTGLGQSHISNFLHCRRQLSLEALDRVLSSQRITIWDLLPMNFSREDAVIAGNSGAVPLVSHAAALFEPIIRPSSVRTVLHLPPALLRSTRARVTGNRRTWERFVAISIPAADASAMDPIVLPEAIVILDRHYTSLFSYRPNRQNMYAVRNGNHLVLRYIDFLANRVVLRPHNRAYPVELLEVPPGEAPGDLIAGRTVLIVNEF